MLNKILIFSLAVLFILGCGEGEDRQQKYLERAQKFYQEENYSKARIEARNVLQINPKNIEARQLLGEISLHDGDVRRAYGMFKAVLDENPDHVAANTSLAEIYIAVNGFEKALEHADKALILEPNNAKVMGFKSLAYAGLEQTDKAVALAEQTLVLEPGNAAAVSVLVQTYFTAGEEEKALQILEEGRAANKDELRFPTMKIAMLEKMGRMEELEQELKMLVAAYPDNDAYVNILTKYYIREARLVDAEKIVRDFADNSPESVDAKLKLVAFLLRHVGKEAAVEQAEEYVKDYPDQGKYYTALAQVHLFTGDRDAAEDVLNTVIDRDPRSVGAIEARNLLAGIFLDQQQVGTAKKILEEVLDIEPENPLALLMRARLAIMEGKIKDGIIDLRIVLKNDPESVEALKLLANAQERDDNEELALDNYKKLLTLQKPDLQVLAGAARVAIKIEQYQDAENFIRQALELDANNPALVTNIIRLLVLKEDWDSAKTFAQGLTGSEDSEALGYFLLAGLDMRLEEFDTAIKNLKKSLQVEPKAVESLTSLSAVLRDQQGAASAIEFVDNHCQTYPDQAHCPHILGSLLAQDKQYDKAILEFEKAISIAEKLVASYRHLAKVYLIKEDFAQVETALKRGLSATGNQGLAFELANFYYQTEDFESAKNAYLSILAKDNNALSAKNNLAMLYVEHLNSPKNVKEALALIADLQDTENPAYLDTVGWVFYLSGDYDQAVTYLKAAVDQVGSSGLLQYHLGMAYYKVGDSDSAKRHLELAIANPEEKYIGFDEAQQTLAKIQ